MIFLIGLFVYWIIASVIVGAVLGVLRAFRETFG